MKNIMNNILLSSPAFVQEDDTDFCLDQLHKRVIECKKKTATLNEVLLTCDVARSAIRVYLRDAAMNNALCSGQRKTRIERGTKACAKIVKDFQPTSGDEKKTLDQYAIRIERCLRLLGILHSKGIGETEAFLKRLTSDVR